MAYSTKIEWTQATWNTVTGCTPVSPGCKNCYARRAAKRLAGRCGYPADEPFRLTLHPEKLDEPLHWQKPRMIFVCSMSDLFHESVPDEFIDKVFAVMALAQQHTFQVLTKRPRRMVEYLTGHAAGGRHIWTAAQQIVMPRSQRKPDIGWPLPNVWAGVTTEDQQRADERIPLLLQTPAAVRFVSCEPLLGPIDLTQAMYGKRPESMNCFGFTDGFGYEACIQWVIAGAETGPGARPADPDWVRSLRDQCREAGVPFFFKRWSDGTHLIDGQEWRQMPDLSGRERRG